MLYSFTIAGIEVGGATDGTNYVISPGTKIEHDRDNANGNVAIVLLGGGVTALVTPVAGNTVIIKRGIETAYDDAIFEGQIKRVIYNEDNTILIQILDPLQKLKYDLFTISYDRNVDPEAGELSAIASDILLQGGFTASVVSSGIDTGDITVDKFISNNHSRLNRLNLIQKLLNWILYYDYNAQQVRFEPKGYASYPTTLNVGAEIVNIPNWENDIENMRNKITVTGAKQLDTRVDTFSGDSSTTQFELTYTPVSMQLTVGGVLQELGIEGSTTGFAYQIDVERKMIKFVTAPATASNNIVATYTTYIPTPVTGQNDSSIELYGLTQHEQFDFEDVVTVDDAEVRVQQLLDILSQGEINTALLTTEYSVKVGNSVTVADSLRPANNGTYVVQSKIMNYGSDYDVIKIGTPRIDINKLMSTIDERLKQLEGKDRTLAAILKQLISLSRSAITVSRESLKLEKRNMTNSWTPGHVTLAYLRASQSDEADCSTNGNHGVWSGTDVTTGTQYTNASESAGVITQPLQRLACATLNGTNHKVTSTVSEAGIVAVSFFMNPSTNSRDVCELDSGKYISLDASGNITTTGLTTVVIEQTAMTTGTHVYVQFDAITATNPTVGFSTTYYHGDLDEFMIFNATLSAADKLEIQQNKFINASAKFANCKLWWSFDNPLIGDRRTAYVTVFDTTY